MKILQLQEIKKRINLPKIIQMQEEGFKAFSQGKVSIPLPGYLEHEDPSASYHIKYGYIRGDKFWIVKIAGGPHNLPMNGMMLAINSSTGSPEYLLQDDGYLTQMRTAIAGLICAKFLANKNITNIGIVGTGEQSRLQLNILKEWTSCRNVYVWGRSESKVISYQKDMKKKGFEVLVADSITTLAKYCNLIITTTSSESPLLKLGDIQPGTHITATGADSPRKIELDPYLVASADIISVDSKEQCIDHGEVSHAYANHLITKNQLIELGDIIFDHTLGRKDCKQITISDLTGIAVQDIQIAKSIINVKLD